MSERLRIDSDVLRVWRKNCADFHRSRKPKAKSGKSPLKDASYRPPSIKREPGNSSRSPGKGGYRGRAATVIPLPPAQPPASKIKQPLRARKIAQRAITRSVQRANNRKVVESKAALRSRGKIVEEEQTLTGKGINRYDDRYNESMREENAFVMDPFVGSKFEDNYFVLMDKGASEISSCAEETDSGQLNSGEPNGKVSFTLEGKLSMYVCNDCRQIFRFSNNLLAHQRMCQVTKPVKIKKTVKYY